MCSFFLIRNLLSVKTALSIYKYHFSSTNPVFSIESESDDYYEGIKRNVPNHIQVIKTFKSNSIFSGLNVIYKYKELCALESDVKKLFKDLQVKNAFFLYPLHEKDALYLKVALDMDIKVSFYEEGSCFYTSHRGRVKSLTSDIKFHLKNLILRSLGIKRGYVANPHAWYSILPISKKNNTIIRVDYNQLDLGDVRHVFFSRPVNTDFPSVSLNMQASAMLIYLEKLQVNESAYIKFHPRESEPEQDYILEFLNKNQNRVTCKKLEMSCAAEDVLYNLPKSGTICGFDTSTLIYANSINNHVMVYSVLPAISNYDKSNELQNLYVMYSEKFKHINFLSE